MRIINSSKRAQFELSAIKRIELAAAKIPGAISLAQGIPYFNTPDVITDFVCEAIQKHKCDKYTLTTGLPTLREEISLSLAEDKLKYDPESEIIITVGSIEGITASLLALTEPGDEVIVPSPSYASYTGCIYLAGCTPKFSALDEDKNFDFSIEQIEKNITRKTSAILFCSPNNPTGTVYSEKNTLEILKLAEKHDLAVILDEVYKDFYYSGETHFTAASVDSVRNRIVRVCSFSKAFAMTGWRVGFLHADKLLCERILKYHDSMVTCAPVASQYAALAALRYGEPYLKDFIGRLKVKRDYTIEALDKMSPWLDYQLPNAAYFVFPRIKNTVPLSNNSTALAYDILDKAKLALVPGLAFGPSGESHLRISYGREKENLEEGLVRLQQYFSAKKNFTGSNFKSNANDNSNIQLRSLRRSLARFVLKNLLNSIFGEISQKIIGIVGTRGKTVFKRTIERTLDKKMSTRSGILSYNTDIGLPLSILNVRPETKFISSIGTIFKACVKSFFAKETAKTIILEFGFHTQSEAKKLAEIAPPEWLIVTDMEACDPNLDHQAFLKGLLYFSRLVAKGKILWCNENEIPPDFAALFSNDLSFSGNSQQLTVSNQIDKNYLVGISAQRAENAANLLLRLIT